MAGSVKFAWAAALLVTAGFAQTPDSQKAEHPYRELPYTPSLDVASMDRSVDACEDFYTYSCGGWQKNNPIPADESSWSVYGKLHNDNQHYLWGILEDAAKTGTARTPTQQKIGDYFAACMDVDAIEKVGSAPLAAEYSLQTQSSRTPATPLGS
jgi:putative endopeptidase